MSDEFIEAIEVNLPKLGYNDRSQFVRDAVYEKMKRSGVNVPREITVGSASTRRKTEGSEGQKKPRKLNLDDPKDVETILKASVVAAGLTPRIRSEPSSKSALPSESEAAPKHQARASQAQQPPLPKVAPKRLSSAVSKPNTSF